LQARFEAAMAEVILAQSQPQPDPQSQQQIQLQQPIVEYLEDSSLSIEYFKIKNSVYFSKIDKKASKLLTSSIMMNDVKAGEDKIKQSNMSAANQDEFILSSVYVLLYLNHSAIRR
jgi:hypothetical protein